MSMSQTCRLAFDRKGLTRRERADQVRDKPGYFEKYGKAARRVLEAVLTRFSVNGYMTLDEAMRELQDLLYQD
jgi:type I restriction enzyme R subunit